MLDEIQNTRLFRLKQRALPWYFNIAHLAGESNYAAVATSRHPSPAGSINLLNANDIVECAFMNSIKQNTPNETSLSWDRIVSETQRDPTLSTLLECVQKGFQEDHHQIPDLKPYWRYCDALYELDGVLLYNDRVVVPPSLRQQVIDTLHAAHQGVSSMEARARATSFWPGLTSDIEKARASCEDCIKNAPSQPRPPPATFNPPSTPFEAIVADFFKCAGYNYLVIADRLSAWADIFKCTPGSPQSGAEGLIGCLRNYFARFGVPTELSSDGGPEFTAGKTEKFLSNWGVKHRLSSAYNPQSNGRAEVAVKSAKRLLRSNIGTSGSLDTDGFLKAMLQLRNTPDPDCHLSPAQIIFGRPLRDTLAFANRLEKFSNPEIRPTWREAWKEKETALRHRYHRTSESLQEHSRCFPPLSIGDKCYVQNQSGNHPKRWDRSGSVVDVLGNDSYLIKIDGSGRLTQRNCRFLQKFMPVLPFLASPVPRTSPSTGKDTYPKPRGEGITTTNPDATQVPLTPHPTPAIASQNDEYVFKNQPS